MPRIDKLFGAVKAADITPGDILAFLKQLEDEKGLSASSVNHHRTILNSIFSHAVRFERFNDNPATKVPQWKQPSGRSRLLEPHEFVKLLEACGNDIELASFIFVMALTAMRKGEFLPRRWDEIDLDGSIPHIQIPQTKNDEPKVVQLTQLAVKMLKQLPSYRNGDAYVFPARPNPKYPNPEDFQKPHMLDIGKRFRRARRRAGIENFRIHDLRHVGPSILLQKGISEEIVRRYTGHRGRMVRRYQHLSPRLQEGNDGTGRGGIAG